MVVDRDKELIARRFDRQADVYESVTPVQSVMAERLMATISAACSETNPLTMLDLGCGPGRLTRRFLETYPGSKAVGIDVAAAMIKKAQGAVPRGDFIVGDAETYVDQCTGSFDVIASNAAVQWFERPVQTLRRCLTLLKPGGILAVATFGDKTFRELQEAFNAAYAERGEAPAQHVHVMPSAAYWQRVLPELTVDDAVHELTFPTVRDFLHSIQRAGATHSPSGQSTLTRSLYNAMTTHYQRRFSSAEGVRATYHALYLVGTTPAS